MTRLPEPTNDLDLAKRHLDEYGYCLLKDALAAEEVEALRSRALEQLKAEVQLGINPVLADKKQPVRFLIDKGQVFRDMVLHEGLHELVRHVLRQEYLLQPVVRLSTPTWRNPITIWTRTPTGLPKLRPQGRPWSSRVASGIPRV